MAQDASTSARGDLILRNLTKTFGDFVAVDDLSLTIAKGSFFALLGPSGCGKTTTLRMIAGLEEPTSGSIHVGTTEITDMKPYQRPVNTVFQNYALFPHLSIYENIAFGLRRRGISNDLIKEQVDKVLNLVELPQLAQRKPGQSECRFGAQAGADHQRGKLFANQRQTSRCRRAKDNQGAE